MPLLITLYFLLLQNVQPPAASLNFDTLKASPAVALQASMGVQELTVNWSVYAGPAGQLLPSDATRVPVNRFEVAERRVTAGPLQRERNPELSPDQLVVVGADLNGSPVAFSLVKDPRIVRAEQPGADGVLTGTVFYRTDTQLTFVLPDVPQVIQVGVYEPRWTGTSWLLDLIATFPVAQSR